MSGPSAPAVARQRGPALAWVASIGVAGASGTPEGSEAPAALPQLLQVLAARGDRPGLALLAPAGAPLPQSVAAGAVGVIFEGGLHNRDALRAELAADRPPGIGDAELVALAYAKWGEELVGRLRGAYAVVLWDADAGRLLAVRDRLGVYPLCFTDTGRETLLATSPNLLRLHPRTDGRLNRAFLAELVCLRFLDAVGCAYAAMRRVPPGHRLVRTPAGERLERYWSPRYVEDRAADPEEILERFEELLDRAVDRCLASGPAAIFLSGGLDSVSIAALAAARCRERGAPVPHALSLVFPDRESNEEAVQRAVARDLGLSQSLRGYFECGGGERALAAAAAASRGYPSPAITLWRAAYLGLGAEARREGRVAILTGHGGDEWLGVSIYLAADHIRRRELASFARMWGIWRRSYHLSRAQTGRILGWEYGLRPVLAAAAIRALGRFAAPAVAARKRRYLARSTPAWLAPDPELRRELAERAQRLLPEPPRGDFYRFALAETLSHPFVATEMEEVFETGRQLGVAMVSPYLDDELVEFLHAVPPEVLFLGGLNKGLVRQSLARRFPELGFERQKKVGATTFFRSLVSGQGWPLWKELGDLRALRELGVLDAEAAEAELRRKVAAGSRVDTARLWFALSVESWACSR